MPQTTAVIACTRFQTISSRVGSAHLVVAPKKNCLRRRVLTEKCFCEYVVNQAMLQGMVRDDHRCAPELISFRKTAFLPHVPSDFSACGTISCLAAVLPAPGVQQRRKQSCFSSPHCSIEVLLF
jgi:hypothetical protein